jgi:hypothetical protein
VSGASPAAETSRATETSPASGASQADETSPSYQGWRVIAASGTCVFFSTLAFFTFGVFLIAAATAGVAFLALTPPDYRSAGVRSGSLSRR